MDLYNERIHAGIEETNSCLANIIWKNLKPSCDDFDFEINDSIAHSEPALIGESVLDPVSYISRSFRGFLTEYWSGRYCVSTHKPVEKDAEGVIDSVVEQMTQTVRDLIHDLGGRLFMATDRTVLESPRGWVGGGHFMRISGLICFPDDHWAMIILHFHRANIRIEDANERMCDILNKNLIPLDGIFGFVIDDSIEHPAPEDIGELIEDPAGYLRDWFNYDITVYGGPLKHPSGEAVDRKNAGAMTDMIVSQMTDTVMELMKELGAKMFMPTSHTGTINLNGYGALSIIHALICFPEDHWAVFVFDYQCD